MAERDIIIGTISNYSFDQIKPWVNSLKRSGFTGKKIILTSNVKSDVIEELIKHKFTCLNLSSSAKPFTPVVDRFLLYWQYLSVIPWLQDARYIIATDVKDVIFQYDPTIWLEKYLPKDKLINASSESIRYRDETWGAHNLLKSFGNSSTYSNIVNNEIFNCGVLAGNFKTMLGLFHQIYLLCEDKPRFIEGGGGPDQAAYNVLLSDEPYKSITNFAKSESGWAAQLGTTKKYTSQLLEPSPILIDDTICTWAGVPFSIVHQYDRVPNWKEIIERKYQ